MSNTKHTPAPWKLLNIDNERLFPSVVLHGDEKSIWNRICINVSHDQEMESIRANARLIAAAPELLEELKHCVEALKIVESPLGATKSIIERAEKLIHKAEN